MSKAGPILGLTGLKVEQSSPLRTFCFFYDARKPAQFWCAALQDPLAIFSNGFVVADRLPFGKDGPRTARSARPDRRFRERAVREHSQLVAQGPR